MKKKSAEKLFVCALGIFVFIITVFWFWANNQELKVLSFTKTYSSPDAHLAQTVSLQAKGYIIYNLNNNKILKAENATTTFALASLSKVLIIGAYLDFKKQNNQMISEDTYAYIQKILIESDNEAIEDLNARFQKKNEVSLMQLTSGLSAKLGFPNEVNLTNPSGLDIDEVKASNFGTPRAVGAIYSHLYKNYPEVFQKTKFLVSSNGEEKLLNTNKTTDKTFGILSSKTGYTDVAGGNLAVTVSPAPGSEYLLIVFDSSKEGRFSDIQKLNNLLPALIKIQ